MWSESLPEKLSPTTMTQTTSLMSLPHDLLLNCMARVSRLYYPTLSLVSKRFRSLIASPCLYKTRSLLGHTESCLYVCVNIFYKSHWYTLCKKPNQTLTNDDTSNKKKESSSSGYALAKVPVPSSLHTQCRSLVASGSDIYNVCESIFYGPSSSVSVLDCRTHTWREGPSLRVQLSSFTTSLVDGNIYVAGSYEKGESFEVLDTKTQIWEPVAPIPFSSKKKEKSRYYHSACIGGKFHVDYDKGLVAYNAKERRWDLVKEKIGESIFTDSSYCEIENVLYSVYYGRLSWYDTKAKRWRGLVGLPELPSYPSSSCIRLSDYGGKIAVFWEDGTLKGPSFKNDKKTIWSAVIKLYKDDYGEVHGKVEWVDNMVTVFGACDLIRAFSVTL